MTLLHEHHSVLFTRLQLRGGFPLKQFDLDCIQLQLIRPLSMKIGSKDALMRMLKLCGHKSLSSYADPVCTKHSSSCAVSPGLIVASN